MEVMDAQSHGTLARRKGFYKCVSAKGQSENVNRVTECRKDFGNPVLI